MTSTTADDPALADDGLPGRKPGTPPPGPQDTPGAHDSPHFSDSPDSSDSFDRDDLPTPPGATWALLTSLLGPLRARVVVASLVLLVQQAAVQAGPLLVAYAIDRGVPAFRNHDHGPLVAVGVGYTACAVGAGLLQYAFIRAAARINQDVLLDLRGRIFRHSQALSVDFHERYTSGGSSPVRPPTSSHCANC